MLGQLCDDTSDTVLIENNESLENWFQPHSLFSMRAALLALTLTLGVNGPERVVHIHENAFDCTKIV